LNSISHPATHHQSIFDCGRNEGVTVIAVYTKFKKMCFRSVSRTALGDGVWRAEEAICPSGNVLLNHSKDLKKPDE
jgi:hypothetical protein